MRSFSLPLSDCWLTQAEFYEFFEFLLYWVLVLYLNFRAGIYGTKTGKATRKIKFVIFACSFASIAGGHTAFVRLNLCRKNGLVFAPKKALHTLPSRIHAQAILPDMLLR